MRFVWLCACGVLCPAWTAPSQPVPEGSRFLPWETCYPGWAKPAQGQWSTYVIFDKSVGDVLPLLWQNCAADPACTTVLYDFYHDDAWDLHVNVCSSNNTPQIDLEQLQWEALLEGGCLVKEPPVTSQLSQCVIEVLKCSSDTDVDGLCSITYSQDTGFSRGSSICNSGSLGVNSIGSLEITQEDCKSSETSEGFSVSKSQVLDGVAGKTRVGCVVGKTETVYYDWYHHSDTFVSFRDSEYHARFDNCSSLNLPTCARKPGEREELKGSETSKSSHIANLGSLILLLVGFNYFC